MGGEGRGRLQAGVSSDPHLQNPARTVPLGGWRGCFLPFLSSFVLINNIALLLPLFTVFIPILGYFHLLIIKQPITEGTIY